MNKKLLLSTTIAGTMFVVGMSNSVFAANNPVARFNSNYVAAKTPSVAIELKSGDVDLTRAELVSILENKYSSGIVKSVSYNNSVISDPTALVPTSATVSLNNGTTLTVVLYGDVNSDGVINARDARVILNHDANSKAISDLAQLRAADVRSPKAEINGRDARRILAYDADSSLADFVDPDCLPDEEGVKTLEFTPAFSSETAQQSQAEVGGQIYREGNSITAKIQVSKLVRSANRNNEWKKWFPVQLNGLPTGTWTAQGVEFRTVSKTSVIVYVDAEQLSSTFTLSNGTDRYDITVNILDISEPHYDGLAKATEDTSTNGALIESVEETVKDNNQAYTVKTNVNRMEYYKLDDVDGYWYKVRAKVTGISTDLVEAVKPVSVGGITATNKVTYKTEKIDDDEIYIYLNAYDATSEISFVSKYATSDQLKAVTAPAVTVTVSNQGKLKLDGVAESTNGTIKQSDASFQVDKNACTPNTIVVKGDLRKLTSYKFTDKSKGTATTPEEGGNKYYALVVDFGDLLNTAINVTTGGDNIVRLPATTSYDLESYFDTLDSANQYGNPPTENQSFLLWLDANNEETEFEVRADADAEGGATQEHFRFTVKFVDTSAPIIRAKTEAEDSPVDVKVLGETTLGADYATNVKATTLTDKTWSETEGDNSSSKNLPLAVSVRKSAMKTIYRADGNTMWYALKVKTQVKRSQLVLIDGGVQIPLNDLVGEATGLADDEIVLWVDANITPKTFTIANVNNTTNTQLKVTVTTTDKSLLKVTSIARPTTITDTGIKKSDLLEDKNYGQAFVDGVIENSKSNWVTITSNTNVQKIEVVKNSLKTFTFRLGTGKWVPVQVNLSTAINVKNEGNLATEREKIALGLAAQNAVILWVNADDPNLKAKDNVLVLHSDDNAEIQETHTYYYDFEDTSVFKDDEVVPQKVSPAMDAANKEYRDENADYFANTRWSSAWGNNATNKKIYTERYYANNLILQNGTIEAPVKEGNIVTINVHADFNQMYEVPNSASKNTTGSKNFTLKFDLLDVIDLKNENKENWLQRSQKSRTLFDLTKPLNWASIDYSKVGHSANDVEYYGLTDHQDWLNEGGITSEMNTDNGKLVCSRVIEYAKASAESGNTPAANKDKLIYVINYYQQTLTNWPAIRDAAKLNNDLLTSTITTD